MRKEGLRGILGLVCLLITCSLSGCGASGMLTELLESVPIESEEAGDRVTDAGEQKVWNALDKVTQDEEVSEDSWQDTEVSFLYEEGSCYAYNNLSQEEQIWYQDIAESLGLFQESIRLDKEGIEKGLDETDIDKIFQCVLTDHPELFYVEGYAYTKYNRGDKIIAIEFNGTYGMDEEKARARQEEIDQKVQVLLEGGAGLTDDYDKVKYVYEALIRNTEYDLDSPDNQNIYSVFVNQKSVCQGYAKALQYLLERMGVECTLVQGTVDTGEGHAWNLVKVNGSYYYVDATWGDASYMPDEDETITGYVPKINYDYLCVTTKQLLRTHILGGYVPMPTCLDETDNYYVREGALFSAYDKEQMQALFSSAWQQNKTEVTLKCADAECYQQILSKLIEEREIFRYLEDSRNTIAYTQNEKQLSMTFWVTNE